MSAAVAERPSAAHELAATLRERILDGDPPGGARLREVDLGSRHGVARHTVRAALRALAGEGLVVLEPNRGARVARLDADAVRGLFELRTALEVEAARLALERHGGLPAEVSRAVVRLRRACERTPPRWGAVVAAHDAVHGTLVAAAGSPRLASAHAALGGETRLFLVQLRPAWTYDRMADDHERLLAELGSRRTDALRDHLREAADAVLARLGD